MQYIAGVASIADCTLQHGVVEHDTDGLANLWLVYPHSRHFRVRVRVANKVPGKRHPFSRTPGTGSACTHRRVAPFLDNLSSGTISPAT